MRWGGVPAFTTASLRTAVLGICPVENAHAGPGPAFRPVDTGLPLPTMPLIYFPASITKWNFWTYCSHWLPLSSCLVHFFLQRQLLRTISVTRSAKWCVGQWLPNIRTLERGLFVNLFISSTRKLIINFCGTPENILFSNLTKK